MVDGNLSRRPMPTLDRTPMRMEAVHPATPHEGFVLLRRGTALLHTIAAIGGFRGTIKDERRFAYGELEDDPNSGARKFGVGVSGFALGNF